MTNPGLNQRLRQRSRRAGFMIGISMALTIAVCVGSFSFIYAALDDTVGDFVARDVPAPVIPTQPPTEPVESQAAAPDEEESAEEPEPAATEAPPEEEVEPTEDADAFTPDFQSSTQAQLNFRSEPSTSGAQETVIQLLDFGTPLQSTGDSQPSDNPETDGEEGWLQFVLEDGTEGWLRAIDVEEFEP